MILLQLLLKKTKKVLAIRKTNRLTTTLTLALIIQGLLEQSSLALNNNNEENETDDTRSDDSDARDSGESDEIDNSNDSGDDNQDGSKDGENESETDDTQQ